jgi:hypothetical protein
LDQESTNIIVAESQAEVAAARAMLQVVSHNHSFKAAFGPKARARATQSPNPRRTAEASVEADGRHRKVVKMLQTKRLALVLLRDQYHTVEELKEEGLFTAKEAGEQFEEILRKAKRVEKTIFTKEMEMKELGDDEAVESMFRPSELEAEAVQAGLTARSSGMQSNPVMAVVSPTADAAV